jgi:methionine transaminase
MQYAIAEFLSQSPEHNDELADYYQRKRDYFLERLQGSRFKFSPAAGTYFQLLDYSAISSAQDTDFAESLIRDAGVAAIPLSPFYAKPPKLPYLRFCFAKNESTLDQATDRLRRL